MNAGELIESLASSCITGMLCAWGHFAKFVGILGFEYSITLAGCIQIIDPSVASDGAGGL